MNELDRLIDKFVPQIRDAFRAAIADITDRAILSAVVDAIKRGDVDGAFRALGFNDAAMRPLTAIIERAFETGGVTVASSFPNSLYAAGVGRIVFRFDVRNSRAEGWLREHSSSLVTRISEETRVNVRNVLTEGMRDGRNPRSVALDIVGRVDKTVGRRVGGIVGLTEQMERYVSGMRRDLQQLDERYFTRERRDKRLDSIVRRAMRDGKSLDDETITRIVGKYSDRLLALRGENIGRTEALTSLNRSAHEAYKQAIDAGTVRASQVTKVWDAAMDRRTRHSHKMLDVETAKEPIGIDEPFKTERGALLMHPGDRSLGAPGSEIINCRCRVRYDADFLSDPSLLD